MLWSVLVLISFSAIHTKGKNKLGLSWAKLSSNWNWNLVLLDLSFVALS